ncbi:MAG: TniB family NTP-binding protein [Anaerolineae bacterium]|nr:TniB family NTP-binding protein [Anaerolineae bacterium]
MMTPPQLPTLYLDTRLDVQSRLQQLGNWQSDWQAHHDRLSDRMQHLNHNSHFDIQCGAQLAQWQQRVRMKLVQVPLEIAPEVIRQVGYAALRQHLVAQFARLSPSQRYLWLQNFLFIMTPDLRQLSDKLTSVQTYRTLGQRRNFLLGGPSGMGKSTFLDWYTLHHLPRVETERNYVPVIKIDAPVSNHTPKPLLQRLILACGMNYTRSDNEEDLLMKLALYFQTCGTELVVIDEVEHIHSLNLKRRLLEVSNLAPTLPMVCASCHPTAWVAGDTEVAGRWNDYFELRQYTGKRLRQLLAYLELLLPFPEPSALAVYTLGTDAGPARLIERWTGGVLRDVMALILDASGRALQQQLSCLTPSLLESTWQAIQTHQVTDFLALVQHREGRM